MAFEIYTESSEYLLKYLHIHYFTHLDVTYKFKSLVVRLTWGVWMDNILIRHLSVLNLLIGSQIIIKYIRRKEEKTYGLKFRNGLYNAFMMMAFFRIMICIYYMYFIAAFINAVFCNVVNFC